MRLRTCRRTVCGIFMRRLPYRRTSEIVLLVPMGLLGKPQQSNRPASKAVVVCITVFAALTACQKNSEIKVYRLSKAPLEESAAQQQDAMPTNTAAPRMPGALAPTAGTAVITPPNWEAQPLSQMRQASF